MKRFRPDLQRVLTERLARLRRPGGSADPERYDLLSPPHRNSPFLTLAEWGAEGREGLPARVVKLLAVLEEDPAVTVWRDILKGEEKRWRQELERRLARPGGVGRLELPLATTAGSQPEVQIATLGPIRRSELLEESAPSAAGDLRFDFLVRPFIPWPRLRDVGFSIAQMQQRWDHHCQQHQLGEHLRGHQGLFRHFCDEALIHGPEDLLLTSAWRLRKF